MSTQLQRDKQRIKNRKRRTSKTTRQAIYERDGYKCLKCGTTDNLTIDHIIPICKGGSKDESNLQTLCLRCNFEKGGKTIKKSA